jgi:hypothetical protein
MQKPKQNRFFLPACACMGCVEWCQFFLFGYLDDRCRCHSSFLFLDLYLFLVSPVVPMCQVIFSAVVIVALCGIKWQIISRCFLPAVRPTLRTTIFQFHDIYQWLFGLSELRMADNFKTNAFPKLPQTNSFATCNLDSVVSEYPMLLTIHICDTILLHSRNMLLPN